MMTQTTITNACYAAKYKLQTHQDEALSAQFKPEGHVQCLYGLDYYLNYIDQHATDNLRWHDGEAPYVR